MGKFFNKKDHKNCSCCVYGEKSEYMDEIFCRKHGVCEKRDFCHHFKYDILKRVPEKISPSKDYNEEDFKIEP